MSTSVSGSGSVIVAGARTPIGRLLGSLSELSAVELGGIAIKAALERAGVPPEKVDYVIMGQVIQAGAGQIPSRQAAVKAGIPMTVPSLTINKVCLSGLDAIALADQLIRAGEFDIVVAGGMESMTNAPHLLPGLRKGVKYGGADILDAMAYDGLTDVFDHVAMGESTERHNRPLGLTREEQDAYALRSHQLAAAAIKNGVFDDEIVPVPVPQRKGEPVPFTADEGVRPDTTLEALARLKPAFAPDGTITAASSSQISDGACAVVVMSKAKADELNLPCSPRSARTATWPGRTTRCSRSRRTRSGTRSPRRGSPRPTSTWSRSTRRSRPWCCSRSRSSACRSTSST